MIFIETEPFQKECARLKRKHLFDEESLRDFQNCHIKGGVRSDPIRGTKGFKKARWNSKGGGKSGGVRIIHYTDRSMDLCVLAIIYPKGETSSLTSGQKKRLGKVSDRLIPLLCKRFKL